MYLNMQQTPKILVILFIHSILDQSEGRGGLTRPFSGRNQMAKTNQIPLAKVDVLCRCSGFFAKVLCPSLISEAQKTKEEHNGGYVCCINCTIQMLFQNICTNGTDPDLPSMIQAESHNGNEYDNHCNGQSFVTGVTSWAEGVKNECIEQSRELCPNRQERLSSANKMKMLRLNHRSQVRNQLRKSSARNRQHRPEPPKAN